MGGDFKGRSGKIPNNQMLLACDTPTCAHADQLPGTIPFIETIQKGTNGMDDVITTHCVDCNLNEGRGGTWACYNKDDTPIAAGDRVPWKGYCKLTCANGAVASTNKHLVCQHPHEDDGSHLQYQTNNMAKIFNFLNKRMFLNDENMSPDFGWMCY